MTDVGTWFWPITRLLEVHDGDTVRLDIDQGFNTHTFQWIRLAAVRAPELDQPGGQQAKADCAAWFAEHAPLGMVAVMTEKVDRPLEIRFRQSFTRYIGHIVVLDHPEIELNAWLRSKGYVDQGE